MTKDDVMNHMQRPGDLDQDVGKAGTEGLVIPGELDQSFGEGGRVTVPFRGLACPSADGKYWTIARRETPPGRLEIRRLLHDGTRDPSFPLDGTIVDVYPDAADFELFAVQRQSSGKLILGGQLYKTGTVATLLFARLGPDGLLDRSFGENGVTLIDFDDDTPYRFLYDISIQSDDKIVASSLLQIQNKLFPRPVRLHADGTRDLEFGLDGVVYDVPEGMILLSTIALDDGKLLFGGMSESADAAVLMCLRSNGSLDTDFGESGFIYLKHPDHPGMRVTDIALSHQDSSIVVGGISLAERLPGWLACILPDGTLDDRFNNGEPLFVHGMSIYQLETQDDGKVVSSGVGRISELRRMAVGRVNRDGSPDATFGLDGIAITPAPAESPFSSSYSYAEIQEGTLFTSDVVEDAMKMLQIQLLRYTLE